MASTKCTPSRETVSPHVAHAPLRPCCLLPWVCPTASPEHHQALRPKLQTVHSTVYRILVVLKPSPFFPSIVLGNIFLIHFPASVFTLSLQLLLGECFSCMISMHHTLPFFFSFSLLSSQKSSLPSISFLSPSSPLP